MRVGKKTFILYFYLLKKFHAIKQQVSNKDSAEGKKLRSRLSLILEKIGIAALTTLLVYTTIVYMNVGGKVVDIWFSMAAFIELGLAFIFLLSVFGAHILISHYFNSGYFRSKTWLKAGLEILTLIIATLLLFFFTNYIPLQLIFGKEAMVPVRVRTAFIVSTIISLFFYYFVERERSKKKLQAEMLRSARLQKENFQAQLQNLKDQVNPHFLFNSLNVLGSLIYKDQDQAVEFTRRLSDLYRSFLDNSNEPLIPLSRELEVTKAYIYLLETRFGKAVQFKLNIAPEIFQFYLPPGSLQMLIENAIKHNGSTSKKPLVIHIYSEDENIVVKNRLQPRREKVESTQTGLKNIQSRYNYLTDKKAVFNKTEEEFIAKLPLLKVEAYENSHR